jgi:hypothetical protein
MLNDSHPPATLLTTAMSPFFSLPSELREEIYFHYVYNSSGCHYDLATRKMRDAAGLPINLALIFTCKMIASEMSGLALQHNTITFTTAEDRRADYWDQLLEWQLERCGKALNQSPGRITDEVLRELKRLYPDDGSVDRILTVPPPQRDFIVSPYRTFRYLRPDDSGINPAYLDLTRLVTAAPDFRYARPLPRRMTRRDDPDRSASFTKTHKLFIDWQPAAWAIPSHTELDALREIFHCRTFSLDRKRTRFHFSAIASTLIFLKSISERVQSQIRTSIINEDRVSVRQPETHANVLVPFSRRNPRLCIDHCVNV